MSHATKSLKIKFLQRSHHLLRSVVWLGLNLLLVSCANLFPKTPGIGAPVAWSNLPGWQLDQHAQAWPALLHSCSKLAARDAAWQVICRDAEWLYTPDDSSARAFFERYFRAHEVVGENSETQGLITGYYEPLLQASLTRSERFRYPLYGRPDDLLTIDLSDLYPELRGRPVRGRLDGKRVVPYYDRAQIQNGLTPLAGKELFWVDDPIALFMLHIQGSGRLRLADGRTIAVGYADQNGHPYRAIGGSLVRRGALPLEEVTLFSIRAWLLANPEQAQEVLNTNPSFIFFSIREENAGPLGSLSVPLTPERSIAVDTEHIPLGAPVWLATHLADGQAYEHLMFAQDTGGAIKGRVRADVFFGAGERAEYLAGTQKQAGRLFVLLPKSLQ